LIYFDTASTTKPNKEVISDVAWCLENVWGNPSSIHSEGVKARQILEQSREKVARFIGANSDEIIFTSSGSESNNLAIKGFLEANDKFGCIITTMLEHPSVYNTCQYLSKNYKLEYVPVDEDGRIDMETLGRLIETLSDTYSCFVSIMFANNEIGTIQPIKEISKIVHKYKGIFHVDATQAVGQIPVDVKELDCDLLSFSGHKLNCPKGVGVLYKKNSIILSPIVHGGHQEKGIVAGTENLPYIYALGNQVERIGKVKPDYTIRDHLLYEIAINLKDFKPRLRGVLNSRLPNNISLTFREISAEALITLLDMRDIYVSAGSACSSGEKTPSRILKAIGLSDEEAFSTIRVSIGENTTTEECDEFVKILGECLASLKMME